MKDMDYADMVPAVQHLTGNKSLSPADAIAFGLANQDKIAAVIAFFKNLFNKHKDDSVPVVLPPTIPVDPQPRTPAPTPANGIVRLGRLVAANFAGLFFIEEWVNGPKTAKPVRKERFDEIRGGSQVTRGASIHFNFSPYDEAGQEIKTNDPRHALVNDGKPYMEYQIKVGDEISPWISTFAQVAGLELHQWDANWGLTPRIKVPGELTESRHWPMQLRARPIQQPELVTDWTPTVFVP